MVTEEGKCSVSPRTSSVPLIRRPSERTKTWVSPVVPSVSARCLPAAKLSPLSPTWERAVRKVVESKWMAVETSESSVTWTPQISPAVEQPNKDDRE